MTEKRGIHTLHRYYIWANRMRVHFDDVLQRRMAAKIAKGRFEVESMLYMSYWYAGLYVVIEGWKALKLSDQVIDKLLHSGNVALLKRYRNGTFHFQKTYYDARFIDLIEKGQNVVQWIRTLNSELGRWFLAQLSDTKCEQPGRSVT
jgi:hypothetical protein